MSVSKELILERDRVLCLSQELQEMLKNPDYYQFKLRIEDDKLTIVPHASSVEIKL